MKRYALGTKNKTLKYSDDGSLTIYLGNKSPGKREGSQLAPGIWLRVQAILDGAWKPPVVSIIK